MAEQRVQDAADKMMHRIDLAHLRTLQRRAYSCSANCFDVKNAPIEQLQNCIEQCQQPMQQAQHYLQQEMQSFQNRLQRCAMDCNDRARDQIPTHSQPNMKIQKELDHCVEKCVDTHISLLSTVETRLSQQLQKLSNS